MRFKTVLWDMDGVIVDSEPLHVAAFRATLATQKYELTDEQYRAYFAGRTDEAGFIEYFKFINETVDVPVLMREKARAYLELAANQLVMYPGVIETMKFLHEHSVRMALVTGSLRVEADTVVHAFALEKYFDAIVTADDIKHGKPHPEGYLAAANLLHARPEDCLVIEDSPSGVQAAVAADMYAVGVLHTHPEAKLRNAGAAAVILSLHVSLFKQL